MKIMNPKNLNGNKINSCRECPYYIEDEFNSDRTWCGKFTQTRGRAVEISINYNFPIICPLPDAV